jgi:RING-variant domain
MGYVHESCLTHWLTVKNTRVCELCHSPFRSTEVFYSLNEIISRNFNYLFADKKRVIQTAIYFVYLYLFGKRYKDILKYFCLLVINTGKSLIGFGAASSPKDVTGVRTFLSRLKNAFVFLYNWCLGVQLTVLAMYEVKRIKGLISFIINNSKRITIVGN